MGPDSDVCAHCLYHKFWNDCGRACDKCGEAAVEGCEIQNLLRFEDVLPSMRRRVFCDDCICDNDLCIGSGVLQNLG
jgi:hypothetical protein